MYLLSKETDLQVRFILEVFVVVLIKTLLMIR